MSRSCLPVGAFYHSLPGSPSFASALWHPLGRDASSLLILTSDSTLREYTVSSSLDEPSQTLSFSRASTSAGPGAAAAATPTRALASRAWTAMRRRPSRCVSERARATGAR